MLGTQRSRLLRTEGPPYTNGYGTSAQKSLMQSLGLDSSVWRHQYVLLFDYVLLNAVCISVFPAVWFAGWLDDIMAQDKTFMMNGLIVAVFGAIWIATTKRAWSLSRELNDLDVLSGVAPRGRLSKNSRTARVYMLLTSTEDSGRRHEIIHGFETALYSRVDKIQEYGSNIFLVGLILTIVSLLIAYRGSVDTSDVTAVFQADSARKFDIVHSLSKTGAGVLFFLWTLRNHSILESAAVHITSKVCELCEYKGDPLQ